MAFGGEYGSLISLTFQASVGSLVAGADVGATLQIAGGNWAVPPGATFSPVQISCYTDDVLAQAGSVSCKVVSDATLRVSPAVTVVTNAAYAASASISPGACILTAGQLVGARLTASSDWINDNATVAIVIVLGYLRDA